MKFLWITSILIVINITLSGQATITGTIQITTAKKATLYLYPTVIGELGEQLEATIEENGQFQFDIVPNIAVPAILNIANAHYQLFLFPEKSLKIKIAFEEALIYFEGAAAKDNQFYLQYQNVIFEEKKDIPQKLLEKFKPKDYLTYQTNLRQRKTEYLHKNQAKIDERLFSWLENDITYQFANNLLEYPNRDLINQRPSKKYYRFLKEIRLNNDAALLQPSYQHFLLGYTNHQLFKPQKWGWYASAKKQFQFIRRYFFGDVLHYLQFFILKTNLKFEEPEKVENAYREFLAANVPEEFKRQLRAIHHSGKPTILGQYFPTNMLHNQYNQHYKDNLKLGNGKVFYVTQSPVKEKEIKFIKQLVKLVNEIKYVDVGIVSLVDTMDFPKELSSIPQFWIPPWSLKKYLERFPVKENAYILLVNKYGQVAKCITSEIDDTSIKEIVSFMIDNNNRRVY